MGGYSASILQGKDGFEERLNLNPLIYLFGALDNMAIEAKLENLLFLGGRAVVFQVDVGALLTLGNPLVNCSTPVGTIADHAAHESVRWTRKRKGYLMADKGIGLTADRGISLMADNYYYRPGKFFF